VLIIKRRLMKNLLLFVVLLVVVFACKQDHKIVESIQLIAGQNKATVGELNVITRADTKFKNKQRDGGPSYYVVQKYKLGTLVGLVQRLTFSGALTTTKAGMLLDIKPLKVHRLFQSEQLA